MLFDRPPLLVVGTLAPSVLYALRAEGLDLRVADDEAAALAALRRSPLPVLVVLELTSDRFFWRVLAALETNELRSVPVIVLLDSPEPSDDLHTSSRVFPLGRFDTAGVLRVIRRYGAR